MRHSQKGSTMTDDTRDTMFDDIRRVAEEQGEKNLNQSTYQEYGYYSIRSIYDEFGSWNAAKEVAGLPVSTARPNYSESEILDDIERVANDMGVVDIRRSQYDGHGIVTAYSVWQRFGSWEAALEQADGLVSKRQARLMALDRIEQMLATIDSWSDTDLLQARSKSQAKALRNELNDMRREIMKRLE